MLTILTDGIGSIDNGKDGDKDVMGIIGDDIPGEEKGSYPKDEAFDDDDSGSSHALKEGQFE